MTQVGVKRPVFAVLAGAVFHISSFGVANSADALRQDLPHVTENRQPQTKSGQFPSPLRATERPISVQVMIPPKAPLDVARERETERRERIAAIWTITLAAITTILGAGSLVVYWMQALRLRQTVEQMRLTEERQLRAYIGVVGSQSAVRLNGTSEQINILLSVRNFGQTPASNVTGVGAAVRCRSFEEIGQHKLEPFVENGLLMPHAETGHQILCRTVEPTLEMDETWQVYVFGLVTYIDAFGITRKTEFRYVLVGDLARGAIAQACNEGNASS